MRLTPSITVVTAVVGSQTDPLQSPVYIAPQIRYVCFTDQPLDAIPAPWERRLIVEPPRNVQPVDVARWVKILVHDHVSTDVIVWQDAAYRLAVDPAVFLPLLTRADLLVLAHPHRTRIEEEADELLRLKLTTANVRKQAQRYRNKGFPESWRLSSTGLLVRRNDARVHAFAEAWYRQLRLWRHSRDQMSFDYCVWRSGMLVHRLEGGYRSNPYADWTYTRTRTRGS